MKTELNFENLETKKLLSKFDFNYFLEQNVQIEKYKKTDLDNIHSNYESNSLKLKLMRKKDKKQFNYFIEGKVRKMFLGGFLPALFELDESRGFRFFDFHAVGDDWAYFDYWQKYYRQKIRKEKIWDVIIKSGSVLAIGLSILKLLEYFGYNFKI